MDVVGSVKQYNLTMGNSQKQDDLAAPKIGDPPFRVPKTHVAVDNRNGENDAIHPPANSQLRTGDLRNDAPLDVRLVNTPTPEDPLSRITQADTVRVLGEIRDPYISGGAGNQPTNETLGPAVNTAHGDDPCANPSSGAESYYSKRVRLRCPFGECRAGGGEMDESRISRPKNGSEKDGRRALSSLTFLLR